MWVNIPVPWILWGNEKSLGRKRVYIAPIQAMAMILTPPMTILLVIKEITSSLAKCVW